VGLGWGERTLQNGPESDWPSTTPMKTRICAMPGAFVANADVGAEYHGAVASK